MKHLAFAHWYVLFPIDCTTDLDCETKNPWLENFEEWSSFDALIWDGINMLTALYWI